MSRKEILFSLINLDKPIQIVMKDLALLEWNTDEQITLSMHHIQSILLRFIEEKLTSHEIEDWANAIESREDIQFSPVDENLIKEIIYELANPLLTTPFNKKRAYEMLALLK